MPKRVIGANVESMAIRSGFFFLQTIRLNGNLVIATFGEINCPRYTEQLKASYFGLRAVTVNRQSIARSSVKK